MTYGLYVYGYFIIGYLLDRNTFSCEPCKFSVTNVGYMQCGHQRLSTIKKSYNLFLHPPYQRENARKIIYKQSQ